MALANSSFELPAPKRSRCESFASCADSDDLLSEESEDDSTTSYQGYATASVWESGDDWSPSSSSDVGAGENFYTVEYELATDTSNNELSATDSDESLSCANVIIPIPTVTIEIGSGSSTEDEEVIEEAIVRNSPVLEPKIERDQWRCVRCNMVNDWPWRYCLKCYRVRKGWLPDRPKKRKTSSKQKTEKRSSSSEKEFDSGSNSQVPSSSKTVEETLPTSSQATTFTESSQNDSEAGDLCERCSSHPSDGLFVHGRTAHQFFCYECCKSVWKQDKHCPICQRTVQKVVKVFRSVF